MTTPTFVAATPLAHSARACTLFSTVHTARPRCMYTLSQRRAVIRSCAPPLESTMVEIPAPPTDDLFVTAGFGSLGLLPELVDALDELSIVRPTAIQSRGIPPILSGANVILGAATGSGKTLAYLLPVVQALKVAEAMRNPGDAPLRIARRPRAVVVVPTRELAAQVGEVAKALAHRAKFRVVAVDGAGLLRGAKDALARGPCDVLVGTTGRLLQLVDAHAVDLRFATHAVIDEVDTMMDKGFGPDVARLLRAMRKSRGEDSPPLQCVAAGATHPRAAEALYVRELPDAVRVNAALHRAPPGLAQRFISVNSRSKIAELDALLGNARKDGTLRGGRVIVFCNTIDSARFLDHYIRERGHTTSCVHGEVPSARRAQEYEAFRNGETQLLVCSDMAARGLDNLAVDHVILFDFPTSAVDYIHRAGRTARAGASGLVTSLVLKKDERLARAIQRPSRAKGDALESAREAREAELLRKTMEESRRRQLEKEASAGGVNVEREARRGVVAAGRGRATAPRGRPGGYGGRGGGGRSFGRGGGRSRGRGRYGRR